MATDLPAKPEILPDLVSPPGVPSELTSKLPSLATPVIGRVQELASLREQVLKEDVRLITLLGPPGVGKTRLALEVAHGSADQFADGALFVDLTPIRDPALIIYALAHSLGVRERWVEGSPLDLPMERVKDDLRDRHVMLVVDNFEHLVDGAPQLGEVLGACPRLKVLATSREPLRLQWEREFPLGPLPLPQLEPLPPVTALVHNPAVAMFLARARAILPDFSIGDHNAREVAEICVRLDGLPLAIELAVGRIRSVPLRTIVAQLARRLEVLTGGARDLPARQRTLRSAIAWSYELLPPHEQRLFRELAVFAGGAEQEAIQAICGEAQRDALSALVDKSLLYWITLPDGSPRYRMLESLREFAWEQLEVQKEVDGGRERHARYFLALAEEAEPELMGPKESLWEERLEREYDNLRLGVEWAIDNDPEVALRYVGALRRFLNIRGHWVEGRDWAERVLERDASSFSPAMRAKALYAGAVLSQLSGDRGTAFERALECLSLRRSLEDKVGTAEVLWYLGKLARYSRDFDTSVSFYEQSLSVAQEARHKPWAAAALMGLGRASQQRGDLGLARVLLSKSLVLGREIGEFRAISSALIGLGEIALEEGRTGEAEEAFAEVLAGARKQGDKYYTAEGLEHLAYVADQKRDLEKARVLLGDSLAVYRELGDESSAGAILRRMGQIAERAGDHMRAAPLIEQSLTLNRTLGHLTGVIKTLRAAGVLAFRTGHPEQAALLLASASRPPEKEGGPMAPELRSFDHAHLDLQEKLRIQYGPAWAAGEEVSHEDACEEALKILRAISGLRAPPDGKKPRSPLSPREREVARLIAQGLTNREIGKRLFISERTVASHIEHILNKLAFDTRAQIAAWTVGQEHEAPHQ